MQRRDSDRRTAGTPFHFPERRLGFDRRRPDDLLRTLADRPRALLTLLLGLNALSIADWALTARALAFGAREANGVMGALFGSGPLVAGAFKVACMFAVSALMWRARGYRLVLATSVGALIAYVALMIYHAAGLAAIGAL